MKRIVVGFDGSEHARRALEQVASLAGPETTVSLVGAVGVHLHLTGRGPGAELVDPEVAAARRQALEEAGAYLESRGIQFETVEAHGDAGRAIVEAAADSGADLVVVGTRGLNVTEQFLLGSVSTHVVHHSPCSVLVVR